MSMNDDTERRLSAGRKSLERTREQLQVAHRLIKTLTHQLEASEEQLRKAEEHFGPMPVPQP